MSLSKGKMSYLLSKEEGFGAGHDQTQRSRWGSVLCATTYIYFCCSVAQACLTFCHSTDCSMPVFHVFHHLPKFTRTHVYWVSDAIQPSHPLSSPSPPALNLFQHQGLSQWVISSHKVAKYWSFSFNISPFNEYSGLISFRTDWVDLLAVQQTFKSLLQHHSLKTSILQCWVFSKIQL